MIETHKPLSLKTEVVLRLVFLDTKATFHVILLLVPSFSPSNVVSFASLQGMTFYHLALE